MKDEQKVYIKGDSKRGAEIIKLLKDLGGRNTQLLLGEKEDYYYFINPNGVIDIAPPCLVGVFSFVKEFYKEIKLPKWKPKYKGNYYFVDDRGKIIPSMWDDTNSDNLRYELGNCFRTPQEAEIAANKIKEVLNQ